MSKLFSSLSHASIGNSTADPGPVLGMRIFHTASRHTKSDTKGLKSVCIDGMALTELGRCTDQLYLSC